MNSTVIRKQVSRIRAMQTRLIVEVQHLQEVCPHEHKTGKYKGDTGNWCPDDDSYWIDAHCLDCDKSWMIESHHAAYKQFDGEIIR